MWAWSQEGVKLPHSSFSDALVGVEVSPENILPGDLVLTGGNGHISLYVGDGNVVHAPGTGKTVTQTKVELSKVTHIRRVAPVVVDNPVRTLRNIF
jgi:peptidoglycan DL-endopeptidase CwlO